MQQNHQKVANPPLFAQGMEQTHSDNIYFEIRNTDYLNSGTRFNTLFRVQLKSAFSNNESTERLECPHKVIDTTQ